MPVPFRDLADLDRFGSAAYLRIVRADDGNAFLGAFFLVNAGGEPLELTYNRIEIAQRVLWRPDDLERHAARRLTATLFEACPRSPSVILCRAGEIVAELLARDVVVDVPTARIAEQSALVGPATEGAGELIDGDVPVQVFWSGLAPDDDGAARSLVLELAQRGLLLEPFERALIGLRELYGWSRDVAGVVDRDSVA